MLMNKQISEIQTVVDKRPSRLEDKEEITILKEKLQKKNRECLNMNEEIKWFKLEMENKEETYNRIFVPAYSN